MTAVQTPMDFDAWVRARLPHLTRFARTLTADEHAAADLVQDTLERALLHWDRIATSPEAYVRRAMVNRSISLWRKLRREHPTDEIPDRGVTDTVSDQTLLEALRGLAPRQRAVVALRYLDDLSEAQTAELLGCSVGTVKSQASAAMKTLRTRLDEIDVDAPAVIAQAHAGASATRRRRAVAAVVSGALGVVVVAGGFVWATHPRGTERPGPAVTQSTTSTATQQPDHVVTGAGLTITLSDAPRSVRRSSDLDPNLYLVHQQDLQAVVDALWRGGARAVALDGRPLPRGAAIGLAGVGTDTDTAANFRIEAVGDPDALTAAIDRDQQVQIYRAQAADPHIAVGWSLERSPSVTIPAAPPR